MDTEIIYWHILWDNEEQIVNKCVASHSTRVDEGTYIYEDINTDGVDIK